MDLKSSKLLSRGAVVVLFAAATIVASLSYEPTSAGRRARGAESFFHGLKALVGLEGSASAGELLGGRLLALGGIALVALLAWRRLRPAATEGSPTSTHRPQEWNASAPATPTPGTPLPPPTESRAFAQPPTSPPPGAGRGARWPFIVGAVALVVVIAVVVVLVTRGGGGSDAGELPGTYVHPEEGTIVIEAGGDGQITQSGDPVPFTWTRDGDTVRFAIDGADGAEASFTDGSLVFRPGDFSGDEPVTFTRRSDDGSGEGAESAPDVGDADAALDVGAAQAAFTAFVDSALASGDGDREITSVEECPFGATTAMIRDLDDGMRLGIDLSGAEQMTWVRASSSDRPAAVFCAIDLGDGASSDLDAMAIGANELVPDYAEYLEGSLSVTVGDPTRLRNGRLFAYCSDDDETCAAEWVADGSELVLFLALSGTSDETLAVDALTAVLPELNERLARAPLATPVVESTSTVPETTDAPTTTASPTTAPPTTAPPTTPAPVVDTGSKHWEDLAAGECVRDPLPETSITTVVVVDCAQPHIYEVIGEIPDLSSLRDPGVECTTLFVDYTGADPVAVGAAITWLEAIDQFSMSRLQCLASRADLQPMTGSWRG